MLKSEQKIRISLSREQLELTEKMRNAVIDREVRTVSFKLFGTLILTPFSEAEDIFLLMEREFPELSTDKADFAQLRALAEEEAAGAKEKKCSPTLARIYEIIGKKCRADRELLDRAMERECQLLLKLCFPRNFGKMLFTEAVSHRKKIIVTADTVYPRNVVIKLLESCGYGDYGTLLVTNELDVSESAKITVYRKIADKAGCSAAKLLHIGGDVEADVETPIMNGSRALLMTGVMLSLTRSGRMYGYLRSELIYGFDTAECLAIHGALGLYAAYVFDIPRQKLPHSDFCGSPYGLGFLVYGSLLLGSELPAAEGLPARLGAAFCRNEEMKRGGEDLAALFGTHFSGFAEEMSREGCSLPLKFLSEHGMPADRQLFADLIAAEDMDLWAKNASSEAAVVKERKRKKNAMERMADRMFPPGTKVRNIADNIMIKLKGKSKL